MTRRTPASSRSPERALRAALHRHLPTSAGDERGLRAALRQGAEHPGKLVRGCAVLVAARHHGWPLRRAAQLAVAIEYFHTASLLLDDLPCMDDATVRRGRTCVHRLHGEATAILAALALINRAYALTHAALAAAPAAVRRRATALLDRALGPHGLVGGQALDLAFAGSTRSAALVSRIAARKTGALFSLAVLLPAELARPTRRERRALNALCVYWGQAYQIADDLADLAVEQAAPEKTRGRDRQLARPNLGLALGGARAVARLARLRGQAEQALRTLQTLGPARWSYLANLNAALLRRHRCGVDLQHCAA
ncbi:MAG: polyprenyl synthetase family protein [Candidatus Didemnitutus sp.]|nr:polyprenyl synthetase family protein [Candidatus Didemnitutus sp.]